MHDLATKSLLLLYINKPLGFLTALFEHEQVEYQCRGFLEKNRDTLYEELVDMLRVSEVTKGPVFFWLLNVIRVMIANQCSILFLIVSHFYCVQFPFVANFFQEEKQKPVTTKVVQVRPARPGVKPANKQQRASVGDKVNVFTYCCCSLEIEVP